MTLRVVLFANWVITMQTICVNNALFIASTAPFIVASHALRGTLQMQLIVLAAKLQCHAVLSAIILQYALLA